MNSVHSKLHLLQYIQYESYCYMKYLGCFTVMGHNLWAITYGCNGCTGTEWVQRLYGLNIMTGIHFLNIAWNEYVWKYADNK